MCRASGVLRSARMRTRQASLRPCCSASTNPWPSSQWRRLSTPTWSCNCCACCATSTIGAFVENTFTVAHFPERLSCYPFALWCRPGPRVCSFWRSDLTSTSTTPSPTKVCDVHSLRTCGFADRLRCVCHGCHMHAYRGSWHADASPSPLSVDAASATVERACMMYLALVDCVVFF